MAAQKDMTLREMVLEQIQHRATRPVPYTLSFEEDVVAKRLDQHYGDPSWRDKLVPYIVACGKIDRRKNGSDPISDNLNRDPYGSIWRTDKRPFHLEEPALKEPTLDGYAFPTADDLVDAPDLADRVQKLKDEDNWVAAGVTQPYKTAWELRGMENLLSDYLLNPGFVEKLYDRLFALNTAILTRATAAAGLRPEQDLTGIAHIGV